jgi:hypothetical protein
MAHHLQLARLVILCQLQGMPALPDLVESGLPDITLPAHPLQHQ